MLFVLYPERLKVLTTRRIPTHKNMKKRIETVYQYEAIFDPNGAGYTVTVPKLPGLVTEGDSLKEAREKVKDAIRCYVEAVLKEKPLSFSRTGFHRERIRVSA